MAYTKLLVFLLVFLWSAGVYAGVTEHPIGTSSFVVLKAGGPPDVKTSYWVFHTSGGQKLLTSHFVNVQVWRYFDVFGDIDVLLIFAQGILVQTSRI